MHPKLERYISGDTLRPCSVQVFYKRVCSVLGCKIWARLKHFKTLQNALGSFGRPVSAGLGPKKHPKTRRAGVESKRSAPLAF
jgi:hypothetical protein